MSLPIAIPNSISRDDGDDESIGSSFSLLEIQNLKSSARSAQEDMTARAEASRSEAGRSQGSPEKLRAPAYLPWWEVAQVAHRSLSPERRLPFWAGQRDADEKRLPQSLGYALGMRHTPLGQQPNSGLVSPQSGLLFLWGMFDPPPWIQTAIQFR